MPAKKAVVQRRINRQRLEILNQLEQWLETPMLILGFIWLALLIIELIWGLSSILESVGTIIWIIFLLDFIVKFALAPEKLNYLKSNFLTVIALALPALRVFRIVRAVRLLRFTRVVRGLRLVRVVTSLNRGMKALGKSMGRRGLGYMVLLTLIVLLSGSAGMYAFENEEPAGLNSYGEALWWTAMTLTTMGSDYFPKTAEGRVLCFLLALYSFTVFGYVTASLASFFIGRDAENKDGEISGAKEIAELKAEIGALRNEIRIFAKQQSST
jgi:voltage-gated potassium channel